MLPEVDYKSRATKPAKPRLSDIGAERKDGIAGTETNADQSILAAISGLNEIRTKQNSYQSSNNSKKKKEHYQEKRKPPREEHVKVTNQGVILPPVTAGKERLAENRVTKIEDLLTR